MDTTHTRTKIGRAAVCAVVALLGAFLLTLSAPVAHAVPPEVTASENPVVIPWGEGAKDITLTWSLAPGLLLGHLTVMESGNPIPVLDTPANQPPGTGTASLTVSDGETYTAQLKQIITEQPLGAPLTITTKRPPLGPVDVGCAVQCITSVDVEPHGGWAQFAIKTNETAIISLEASTTPPNADGTWSNPKAVLAKTATILPTQNWSPPLPDLNSNKTYYYVVRAHDTNGHEQVKTGSFKTLTRRVDVTFTEIEMFDDSDDWPSGGCDCWFLLNVGNQTTPYGSQQNQKSIESGKSAHPNVTVTVMNAPSVIPIRAFGYDDDEEFPLSVCSAGLANPEDAWATNWDISDSNECFEWAGNQTLVKVSRQGNKNAPWEVDEQFTESFQFYVGGELHYTVHGTYKVTYVP